MGRKRSLSYVESSEDEFELSDGEVSPLFSRLKRPKRASSTRDNPGSSASPRKTLFQPEDDGNSSVVIPDSLEQDDRSIPESVAESVAESGANSIPPTPKDPRDEDTRETEGPSEKGENSDGESDREDKGEVDEPEVQAVSGTRNDEEPPEKVESVTAGRKRQKRNVYRVESDSDDAYNSAEDSPPEDDDDSEFDFSPKKPTKKATKAPAKRAAVRTNAQKAPPRKLATRKLATRKPAAKARASTGHASPAARQALKKGPSTDGAKKRLGARMPNRASLAPKSPASGKKLQPSLGKRSATPTVVRSGLSRKAAIPRLHSYLPR